MIATQEEYNNEALNRETLARWQEEFGPGKVIRHDAVVKWLNTWGTEGESAQLRIEHNMYHMSYCNTPHLFI